MQEVLVILDETGRARQVLEEKSTVMQQGSDRVLILGDADEGVASLPGVERVFTGTESPDELPKTLNPAEEIFAKGWFERRNKGPRRGEGLDWDAPGFQAPGLPRK